MVILLCCIFYGIIIKWSFRPFQKYYFCVKICKALQYNTCVYDVYCITWLLYGVLDDTSNYAWQRFLIGEEYNISFYVGLYSLVGNEFSKYNENCNLCFKKEQFFFSFFNPIKYWKYDL